ncbi:glycoside hydrolase [Penicillium paradoxum]|uniref:glycoside hydrolase n=1 Tax=Penicillium paradoxum TaxID=176176 RepID=UPI0025487B99|nr:glycoside hydrolase [Penicillium paradoxum]KAJ5782879.1 glycoside hydrolase [Penicillium paradoxum]
MQLSTMTGALVALGLLQNAVADTSSAQRAMESFLSNHPISTRSAPQSQSTPHLSSLKAAAFSGDILPTRSWHFLREPCPESCSSLGLNSTAWPAYSHLDRLALCGQPMLLDFTLYTPINESSGHVSIRSCAADLEAHSTWTPAVNTCSSRNNTINVTSSLQLTWDTAGGKGNTVGALNALQQIYAYELVNPAPCNETINFAYSEGIAVGLYMGSGLHGQSILAPVLKDVIKYVLENEMPETLVAQLCSKAGARYTTGIYISKSGGLTGAQMAVQTWRNGTCVASLDNTEAWKNIDYSVAVHARLNSSSTSLERRQLRESHLHGRRSHTHGRKSHLHGRDTECTTTQVDSGDTCTTLATQCGITPADFTTYNPSSTLCSSLTEGQYVCCSAGTLPDYSPQPDSDNNCFSYLVETGDTCASLAASHTIKVSDIESYNKNTWGWMGCDNLFAKEYICLSSGWPPMPAVIPNAVCGPQVNDTATVPHGTDLTTLNPCPLNACCDIWGQCGTTAEFCTPTNSTTGAPGTAAKGTNGCISNCGTDLIQSNAPSEIFNIGYFEGYDLSRPCMRTWITDMDLSPYTHIHMSFATLNSDFSFNIDSIESQMTAFAGLSGVKRIIAVGGWDFSADPSTYNIFRESVATSTNRAALVSSTIAFLNKYDLDGVDWDWEYPGEPDIPGIPADTTASATNFFLFLLQLSVAMKAQTPGKTISTTVPSSYWYLKAIPIEAISTVVDYIVIMTYDLHGQWDWNNTHADPGCPAGGCLRSHVNLTETINSLSMITKAGVPSNQIVVGVSSYARSFQMSEAGCWAETCSFVGPDSGAVPGACTNTPGYISNAELASIVENEDVYMYIDESSNSNIMVWNDTQWAAWMDDDVKALRKELYADMNFLGSADWAIDLQISDDALGSGPSSGTTSCEISIDPSIWSDDSPVVTAKSGCTIIWPPMPLSSTTTISIPDWTTRLTWHSTVTKTMTFADSSTMVYHAHSPILVPTILSIPPGSFTGTDCSIPDKFGASQSLPSCYDPYCGWYHDCDWRNYNYYPWVHFLLWQYHLRDTLMDRRAWRLNPCEQWHSAGPYNHNCDPHPYPTTTDTTTDPIINTRTTHRSTATSSDSDTTSSTCVPSLFKKCGKGCGDGGGGGGGSGSGSGSDNSSDDNDSTTSTTTSTEPSSYHHLPGMATEIVEDLPPFTTDALADLQALSRAEAGRLASLFGNEKITSSGTATTKATGTVGTATATATATGGSNPLDCYIFQDPGSGSTGTYCQCPGYDGTLPTLTGSASPCDYTSLPTSTTQTATTTKPTGPYPYTFTDVYGVVVACESESFLKVAGYSLTECDGSSTTLKSVTITVTEVVTTSVMNKICSGGDYNACLQQTENFGVAACPKMPIAQMKCQQQVFVNAQSLCAVRCTHTPSTYTTTYATLAP